ncbi:hypothetical protein [Stenotrophomonas sp.]|uniref:hypothetical protein n=1 Tax=Stenotrophomonas sp. TaxID=69392 RepID=UPI0028AC304B|nr:hypothetical protein [Stenotrophomonas sp.]
MRLLPALALSAAALLLNGCGRSETPAAAVPAATATTPAADPVATVLAASQRFGQLRSFHAVMKMQGPRALGAQMDYVAPDRYRLITDDGTQTIVGGTFFLQRAGEVRQIPVPEGMLAQWRNPLPADLEPAQLTVRDLGEDRAGGQRAHKYEVRHATAAPDGLLYWVNAQGLAVQIERKGETNGQPFRITVIYSRFDDASLRIDIP